MSLFTSKIASARREHKREIDRLKAQTVMLSHPEVKAAFEAVPLSMRKKVSIGLSSFGSGINMHLHFVDLMSFKDKKLTKLLEAFLDWQVEVQDYTGDCPNKDFVFSKLITAEDGRCVRFIFRVYAYVKSDSPLCRVVVTGTKEEIVRTEIKSIVCA